MIAPLTDRAGTLHSVPVENASQLRSPLSTWLKRFAAAGFLFYLVKGLVWLGIGLAVLLWNL